ncbi:MAG: ThuA domain-containing protein [Planctomycetota bacterium]
MGQSPDGHPKGTHEYLPGLEILKAILDGQSGLETTLVRADDPWPEGPELLSNADAVVFFVSEGARWFREDPKRLEVLNQLAAKPTGLLGIHWGLGTRDAANIDTCLSLLGGCHGGPDRKYQDVSTDLTVIDPSMPITRGIGNMKIREEFYYRLKFAKTPAPIPLLMARMENQPETVAWAWIRPGGGRSFGFSGLHHHRNWELEEYRRLIAQAVLWTLDRPIPPGGIKVQLPQGTFSGKTTGDQ